MKQGRFIYITGCDGTGKSTQAQLLVEQLRRQGTKTRHVWLRFPFFFSAPLLAYARLRGYSWRETTNGVCLGYWDFRRSWVLRRVFPWLLLLDAALAGFWQIYLPLWLGYTIVCERYALDMLVDLSVACGDQSLHRRLPGKGFLLLLPPRRRMVILDLDASTIKSRRQDLEWDRILEQRLAQYRLLSADLSIPLLSNRQEISLVRQQIWERVA